MLLSSCLWSPIPSQTTLHMEMPLGGAGFMRLQSPDEFDEVLESGNYRSISAEQLLSGSLAIIVSSMRMPTKTAVVSLACQFKRCELAARSRKYFR